ncbi:hypothetical protein [Streptomyces sp. NPDC004134]|uniref:hypothetical protein n=1 Tax=Streptomyces sp. NPDC004134 TaxID=3364691 RepID=UPI0036B7C0EF
MSKTEGPMGGFEERLLGELKQVVAERAAEEAAVARPEPVAVRAPRPRRRMWAGLTASVGVAAAGAAAVVALPAMGGSAAYAVEKNDDGSVSVTVEKYEDADGLERELEKHGVSAEVDYVRAGMWCQDDRGEGVDRYGLFEHAPEQEAGGGMTFTLRPSEFRPGDHVVIVTSVSGSGDEITKQIGWQVVNGPVQPCNPAPIPEEPDELPTEVDKQTAQP